MEHNNKNERVIKSMLLDDKACPVCRSSVFIDDGYGSMEMQEYCEVDSDHYRYFMNNFVCSIKVNGKDFSDDPRAARDYVNELMNSRN